MVTLELAKQTAEAASLKLSPRVSPLMVKALAESSFVTDLIDALGSPLNVVFPQTLKTNIEQFKEAFTKNGVTGRVFFAHKCNQSDSLTRQLSVENCDIDVSSVKELQHALGSGFTAERIEVTGPKTYELLTLSVQHGVWINIDNLSELNHVVAISRQLPEHAPIKVLLRISGFRCEHSRFLNKGSRFGIPLAELEAAFGVLEQNRHIDLAGFSFHLDTVSVLERTVAVENCLEIFETAINYGFSPRILDIGGGYKVNYLESANDWNRYTSALKEAVLGTKEQMTWQGNAFGLHSEKGVLKGNFNSYNYYDSQTGGDYLGELINQALPSMGNATIASVLRDNMIELWIEPGRALLDQCGATIALVESIRPSSNGDTLVNLSMKRQDVCFLDQEIFVDPIVIHRHPPDFREPAAAYFAGNLCLESDLIYRHKTYLDSLPSPGDVVAFVNTAGYFMDFSATESIMQPIARKVAITDDGSRLRWFLDERYWPLKRGNSVC